jgi:hypothetical protein
MLEVGNVEKNTFWIDVKHQLTYEVIGFWEEYDWDNDCMYRVCHLKNIVSDKTLGVAENIVEKNYVLDLYSQRQKRKEIVA